MRIKKNIIFNKYRAILTETIPFETPIIFSNNGFFKNLNSKNNEIKKLLRLISSNSENSTTPYKYKIKKDSASYRKLSLLHPKSQILVCDFYERYRDLIIYYCNLSKFSIRHPKKSAKYYSDTSQNEKIKQLFNSYTQPATSATEETPYQPSYFTYGGYDRLYKFFESPHFFNLEKNFNYLVTLDISKCFDSIYTHSIAWALRGKEYSKRNTKSRSFFDEIDCAIRHTNHNETNGIPIGPEFSRIFAEIILGKIDCEVEELLNSENLSLGKDYFIRRYVDDYFIFTKKETHSELIYQKLIEKLDYYNLHANPAKKTKTQKPFLTTKSKLTYKIKNFLTDFFEKYIEKNGKESFAKSIWKPHYVKNQFTKQIKVICHEYDSSYDDVSAIIIGFFRERIKILISKDEERKNLKQNFKFISLSIELVFFYYISSPHPNSSMNISTMLAICIEYYRGTEFLQPINLLSYENIVNLLDSPKEKILKSYTNIDILNLIIVAADFNQELPIPEEKLQNFLKKNNDYFDLITLIFYIKGNQKYKSLISEIESKLTEFLKSSTDIINSSHDISFLLDMICCPYIDRKPFINFLNNVYSKKLFANQNEEIAFDTEMQKTFWFTNWHEKSIIKHLLSKELRRSY